MASQTQKPEPAAPIASGTFHPAIRFGLFEVNPESGELRKSGIRIRLQAQPFRILMMLLDRPGEVVTREEIQQQLWGADTIVDFDHSLGTAVNKIREALGDSAENPRFVETLSRRGYRFIAPVFTSEPRDHGIAAFAAESTGKKTAPLRWTFWVAAAAAALIIAVLAFAAGRRVTSRPEAPPLITQVTFSGRVSPGDPQMESLPAAATDGSRIYFSEIANGRAQIAQALIADGETSALGVPAEIAAPSLGDISPDGSKLLLRNHLDTSAEQALWVVSTINGDARRIPGILAHDATWMPDGQRILYAVGNDLYTAQEDGAGQRRFAVLPGRAFWLRWSPDGRVLRFTMLDSLHHTTALWQINRDGGNAHSLLPGWNNPPAECCGSWTADGRYFVFQSTRNGSSNLWQIDEAPGLLTQRDPVQITNGPLSYQGPVPARSDDRVFFIGLNTRSELLGYDDKAGIFSPYASNLSNAARVEFSRDQKWVAWIQQDNGLLWRSRLDGSQRVQLTERPMQVFMMHWSPDGRKILMMGREPGKMWRIYTVNVDGSGLQPLLNEDRNEADPDWSPDGQQIVFGRLPELMSMESQPRAIYLLDLRTKKMTEVPGSRGLFSPRWSPNGRYIAALSMDQKKLMLYDTAKQTWRTLAQMDIDNPEWSPDSKSIFFHNFVQVGQPIYKVAVADGRIERIAGIRDARQADVIDYQFAGLAPGDVPLVNARLSTANIYSAVIRGR